MESVTSEGHKEGTKTQKNMRLTGTESKVLSDSVKGHSCDPRHPQKFFLVSISCLSPQIQNQRPFLAQKICFLKKLKKKSSKL